MFAQDSWTLDRMTLNMGVRFERFTAKIKNQSVGAGRFAPERTFSEVTGMPSWFDIAPRLGISYDLFGNAKTALKATFCRYMAGQTTGFPARYNPLQLQNDTRTWRDTNGDDIAQDSEIGPSNNAAFGLPVQTLRPDPDIQREYDLSTPLIQHEVTQGLSVNAGYYRRGVYNQRRTQNNGWAPSDYTIVPVVSPLDGSILPVYNLDPAKRGNVDRTDFNSTDSDLRRRTYNGVQVGFNGRLHGAQFFGGWTMDRLVDVRCDAIESNRRATRARRPSRPTTRRSPTISGATRASSTCPLHEIKLAGSYPPWQIQVNVALQSYNGLPLFTRWNIVTTTRYAADCLAPCRRASGGAEHDAGKLRARPGAARSVHYERQNQLDMGFRSCSASAATRCRRRPTSSTS